MREPESPSRDDADRESITVGRPVMPALGCGVWTADADGDVTFLSPSLLSLLDRRLDQCLGREFLNVLDLGEREQVRVEWEACVLTQSEWHSVHAIPVAPGQVRELMFRGFPTRDRDGVFVGWVGLAVDVGRVPPAGTP